MQISWNHLNQLIDLEDIGIIKVIEKLTLAGFEVEKTVEKKDLQDIILEIYITANRQDIVSLIDIATEIAALFERSLKLQNYLNKTTKNIKIVNFYKCSNLNLFQEVSACIIENINTQYSNQNIINYLVTFGIMVTHSILDITNFINLKWGQKIKIYSIPLTNEQNNSLPQFQFEKYIINRINNELKIALNNYTLTPINTNNIKQYQQNINIVLINYSYNNITNIKTDKQINNNYYLHSYQDIFHYFSLVSAKTKIPKIIYKYHKQHYIKNTIVCTIDKINQILGPIKINQKIQTLDKKTIYKTLQNLAFNIQEINGIFTIEVPTNRQDDVNEGIDVIEELVRIHGFDKFKDKLPQFNNRNQKFQLTSFYQKIRRILRSMGLHEIINYSLQEKQDNHYLHVINPLNKEQRILRNNLVHNILSCTLYNINQANKQFEVFEIGNTFTYNQSNKNYKESMHLSCVFGNNEFNQSTWQNFGNPLTWFQVKGQIEEFFEKIDTQISWSTEKFNISFTESLNNYINHKKSIYINYKNQTIGILSQLNKQINKILGKSHNIYFFEIDLNKLAETIQKNDFLSYKYFPYSNYPKITRDISITVSIKTSMHKITQIMNHLQKQNHHIIESIILKNEYRNNQKIKTICLRITYRSQQRTLTNEEVKILDKIFKEKLNIAISSKT